MIRIGHAADIHLAPLPSCSLLSLMNKRLIGWSAWHFNRRRTHLREIADCLRDDLCAAGLDHCVVTGDLVNIALRDEFTQIDSWLDDFAPKDWLSIVPGNHDAYVVTPEDSGFMVWRRYMESDLCLEGVESFFPFIRRRGNIALIGISTAVPRPPFIASGVVGSAQLRSLSVILPYLHERGFFRIVLLHHPPLPGMAHRRHDLVDAAAFRDVLYAHGAELVLHGHLHRLTRAHMRTRYGGDVHIIGMPSGSSGGRVSRGDDGSRRDSSHWACYDIARSRGAWRCRMHVRHWDGSAQAFVSHDDEDLNWV